LRGVRFGGLRASLTALPGWNRTALRAAISMVSPLCGFRPWRAGRSATLKLPRPETRTASPATRESRIAVTTALTACPAAVWFSSVARATFSINTDWFISDVQLQHYEIPTLARAGPEVPWFRPFHPWCRSPFCYAGCEPALALVPRPSTGSTEQRNVKSPVSRRLFDKIDPQRHMPRIRAATSTRTPWLAPLAGNSGSASGHAILSKSPSSSSGMKRLRTA